MMTDKEGKIYNVFLKSVGIEEWQFNACYDFIVRHQRMRVSKRPKRKTNIKKLKNKKEIYLKYLNSPEWKKLRLQALEFYGNRCGDCGSKYNLHIHHKSYKNIFRETMSDLMILCEDCHRKVHNIKIEKAA